MTEMKRLAHFTARGCVSDARLSTAKNKQVSVLPLYFSFVDNLNSWISRLKTLHSSSVASRSVSRSSFILATSRSRILSLRYCSILPAARSYRLLDMIFKLTCRYLNIWVVLNDTLMACIVSLTLISLWTLDLKNSKYLIKRDEWLWQFRYNLQVTWMTCIVWYFKQRTQ